MKPLDPKSARYQNILTELRGIISTLSGERKYSANYETIITIRYFPNSHFNFQLKWLTDGTIEVYDLDTQ